MPKKTHFTANQRALSFLRNWHPHHRGSDGCTRHRQHHGPWGRGKGRHEVGALVRS